MRKPHFAFLILRKERARHLKAAGFPCRLGSLEAAFKFILESQAEPVAQKGEDGGLLGAERCEIIGQLLVYLVLDPEKQ